MNSKNCIKVPKIQRNKKVQKFNFKKLQKKKLKKFQKLQKNFFENFLKNTKESRKCSWQPFNV